MNSQLSNQLGEGPTEAEKRLGQPPTEPLTRPERDVLLGFEQAIRQHGSPTLREIAEASGPTYYAPSVSKYLKQLAAKGYVLLPSRRRRHGGYRLLFNAPAELKKKGGKR